MSRIEAQQLREVPSSLFVRGQELLSEAPKRIHIKCRFAGLAVALTGSAGLRFFWDAGRSRRPRWQRAWAILTLLWAAFLLVLAFRP